MGYNGHTKEEEVPVDIESGNGFPGDINNNLITGERRGERLLNKLTSGVLRCNVFENIGGSINNSLESNLDKPSQDAHDSVQVSINKNPERQSEERIPLLDKQHAKSKRELCNSKRASKPPRPPNGPSLDASDLKLVKEISEFVMKKRARKERIKALRKARAAKLPSSQSSSTNSTIFGMTITIVFFLVIIFQGFSWRSSSTLVLHASPEPATGTNGFISVQGPNNLLLSYGISPSSESPRSVEETLGSKFKSSG